MGSDCQTFRRDEFLYPVNYHANLTLSFYSSPCVYWPGSTFCSPSSISSSSPYCYILLSASRMKWSPSNFSTFLSSLVVFYCFDRSYLNGCKMACHCSFDLHSLMDSDVDHLFMCLFFICISSMEKRPFPSSELGYFCFFFFVCLFKSFLHILDVNVLSGIWFANIFSYSVNSLFTLMILSLIYKSFLNFRRFSLCYLCF